MSLLEETKNLLRARGIVPRKTLGQNFLVDQSLFPLMAEHACLEENDVVLDVGAGFGYLSLYLAARCNEVVAVEKDPVLATCLRKKTLDVLNVKVINGDIFHVELPSFNKVISIPPYNISSRLLTWLFDQKPGSIVVVLQKDCASKLTANTGDEQYGWLTVLANCSYQTKLGESVPGLMFYPQPRVESVIVILKRRELPLFNIKDENVFRRFVQSLFRDRNRKVKNAISSFLKNNPETSKTLKFTPDIPFQEKRVRETSPGDFGVLSNALFGQ